MPASVCPALRFLLLVALYIAGDALGELLVQGADKVTLVWLPAGISLAALILYGPRYWPFIPIAEFIVQWFPEHPPLSFIAVTMVANTLAALLATEVARRTAAGDEMRFVVRSGYVLLVAAAALALCSALIGVSGLHLVGYVPADALSAAFGKWLVANIFGVVLVTPAVLLLVKARVRPDPAVEGQPYASRREMLVWGLLLALAFVVLVGADRRTSDYVLGLSSLPLALLMWNALRFPPAVTALSSLLVGLGMVLLAGLGLAGYRPPSGLLDAVILLGFLSLIAVVPLFLAGAANESRLAARRLLMRARTDALTGLPNRAGFEAAVATRLAARPAGDATLIYIDLDNFKVVNDTAGHAAGDALVQQIAGVLRAQLGHDDVLARLGGDEFAVLLGGRDHTGIGRLAQRLRDAIAGVRFPCEGHVFSITASFGLVAFGDLAYSEVLARADTACFTAKELGGNRVQWGNRDDAAVGERTAAMRWAVRIDEGIRNDHFRVFCQSIEPLGGPGDHGRHFEILVRLYDPEQDTLLLPGHFVPAAERFRMGPRLDRHVLDRSLRWLEEHADWAAATTTCSINLCAASVDDEGFIDFLHERLAASSVPAHKLCFEITETSAVRDLGDAQRFIDGVRALGCRLALDDFGTGFCSFSYLDALDVDYLKIDGSFVRKVAESELSLAIVKAVADIARSIDRKSIAEFVESRAIRERLVQLGVDYAQGYAIDRPRPIEEFFADLAATADPQAGPSAPDQAATAAGTG